MSSRAISRGPRELRATPSDGVRDHGRTSSAVAHISDPIWWLHHTVGNQAVQQLLRRQVFTQTGSPGRDSERDADRTSQLIMNGQRFVPAQPVHAPDLVDLKASTSLEATEVPPVIHAALRSSDQPLDSATRSFMEPHFGLDFSNVRVHTGREAGESAKAISANAYTFGHHIVFAPGRFAPQTHGGQSLLAHELAHVAQQNEGRPAIQRQPSGEDELAKQAQELLKEGAEIDADLEEVKKDLRTLQEETEKAGEEYETKKWQEALAKKKGSLPSAGTGVDNKDTAFFVEALIKTSQSLRPFLHDRLIVKISPNFVIDKTREEFESADQEGTNEVKPFSGAHQSTRVYGFYNRVRRTRHLVPDSIHLSPDAKFSDALHEGVHKFSKAAFESVFGKYLNEGVTQIFANLVWDDAQLQGTPRNAYGDQLDCARILMSWLGGGSKPSDLLGNAYFQGQIAPIVKAVLHGLEIKPDELNRLSQDRGGLGLCERIVKI